MAQAGSTLQEAVFCGETEAGPRDNPSFHLSDTKHRKHSLQLGELAQVAAEAKVERTHWQGLQENFWGLICGTMGLNVSWRGFLRPSPRDDVFLKK